MIKGLAFLKKGGGRKKRYPNRPLPGAKATWSSQSFSRLRSSPSPAAHPACNLTAAGPGQSPLPTLPSSLSHQHQPSNHRRRISCLQPGKSAGRCRRKLQMRFILQNPSGAGSAAAVTSHWAPAWRRMAFTKSNAIRNPWQHFLGQPATLLVPLSRFLLPIHATIHTIPQLRLPCQLLVPRAGRQGPGHRLKILNTEIGK